MASSASSKYHVGSATCAESELSLVSQALAAFPQTQGAVTFNDGKALYCLNLSGLTGEESKALVQQVSNVIDLILKGDRQKNSGV